MKTFNVAAILLISFSAFAFDNCFTLAAAEYGVRKDVLVAIARWESKLNPYAVNVAGKSYYPATKEEAETLIKSAAESGKSFDVGLMQINRYWFKKTGYPYTSGLDGCFNVRLGAWVLAMELKSTDDYWAAIGKYHSPTEKRANEYMWHIYSQIEVK